MNDLLDRELGDQVGRALRDRDRVRPVAQLALEGVVTGAKRRRARRRQAVAVASVVLVAAAGLALSTRSDRGHTAVDTTPDIVRPQMLPAFAFLDEVAGFGEPNSVYATRGGTPRGRPTPRVDVWEQGQQVLVVRTVDEAADESTAGSSPETVAVPMTTIGSTGSLTPWGERDVTRIDIRGEHGAIEELASDQFAVWVPTSSDVRYTLVIARGMSRAEAVAAVEAMVVADGALQPAPGYQLSAHADALPASEPVGAFAQVGYANGPFVMVVDAAAVPSLELAEKFDIGRVEQVDGRDVMLFDLGTRQHGAEWLDAAGVVASVWVMDDSAPQDLIPRVRMRSQAEFVAVAESLSAQVIADLPVVDEASVGGVTMRLRSDDESTSLCAVVDDQETCMPSIFGRADGSLSAQVEIGGHWVMFGIGSPQEPGGAPPEALRVASADESCCETQMAEHDGSWWWSVRVDDSVDVVHVNLGDVFGGPTGDIARPLVPGGI